MQVQTTGSICTASKRFTFVVDNNMAAHFVQCLRRLSFERRHGLTKLSASRRVARGEFSASPILPPTCFSIGSAFCICVAVVFQEGDTSHIDTNRYIIMYVLKDISDFTTGSEDRYVLSANQGIDTSLIDINEYIIVYVLKDIYVVFLDRVRRLVCTTCESRQRHFSHNYK